MIPEHHNLDNSYEKSNILLLTFVAASIFLWSNGFDLRIFDLSDKFKSLTIAANFIILIVASISLIFKTQVRYTTNYYFLFIMAIFAAIFLPSFLNLVITSGLSFKELFRSGLFYSGIFIFVILIAYTRNPSTVIKLNSMIVTIISINVFAFIVLSFFPDLAKYILVKTLERYDRIRIGIASGLGPMLHYTFFYLLVMCAEGAQSLRRNILPYLLSFIALVWYIFAVEMGRRTIFAILAVTIYYLFIRMTRVKKIRMILLLPFIFSLFVIIPQSSIISDSIQSSFITATEEFQYGEGNVGIRVFGIEYYMNLFKESGFVGIGMFSNKLPGTDPLMTGAESFRYNPADHGIFAVLYQFGFPAIILTVIILLRIFRDLKLIRQHGLMAFRPIAIALHLYFIFSIIGLWAIFWKPIESFCIGIMFFMIWQMSESTRINLHTINNDS